MKSYLFPGQGAQTVTMAGEILSAFPQAVRLYDEAQEIIGTDLRNLLPEQLAQTRFAQLAIIVHSISCLEKQRHGSPESETVAMAGFSLGEYTALYAAGIITFSDLLRLVNERAKIMQEATKRHPGTMYAIIGLRDEQIEETIAEYEDVYAVNFNCPGQLVIAGKIGPTDEVAENLLAIGARRAHKLAVNGAFHTPLMNDAAEELERFAASISFQKPRSPIYSNTTADRIADDTNFPRYLAKHMVSPVRFTDEIRKLRKDGFSEHIELGPGHVLTGLVKKI
ncbi:MAG: ACP S-malonyltransferase [Clostridiales bacterium]|nr:ACP S-malonyltransferase [Clostridiales bacterium]